jgi:hypothetical protein
MVSKGDTNRKLNRERKSEYPISQTVKRKVQCKSSKLQVIIRVPDKNNSILLEIKVSDYKHKEFTNPSEMQMMIKSLQSIFYFERQVKLSMFSQLNINLLHYNCFCCGSSMAQDQLNPSALNSRSGYQLTVQCYSSKRTEIRIHRYSDEDKVKEESYSRLQLRYSSQIILQFIYKLIGLNLQSIISQIQVCRFPNIIIIRSHYSCFPYRGSLVQDQLKLRTLNS